MLQVPFRSALFGYRRRSVAAFLDELASSNAAERAGLERRLASLRVRLDEEESGRREVEEQLAAAREEYRALVATLEEIQRRGDSLVARTRERHEREEGERLVTLARRQAVLGEREGWIEKAGADFLASIDQYRRLLDGTADAAAPSSPPQVPEVQLDERGELPPAWVGD